jgi:hypothetical protein
MGKGSGGVRELSSKGRNRKHDSLYQDVDPPGKYRWWPVRLRRGQTARVWLFVYRSVYIFFVCILCECWARSPWRSWGHIDRLGAGDGGSNILESRICIIVLGSIHSWFVIFWAAVSVTLCILCNIVYCLFDECFLTWVCYYVFLSLAKWRDAEGDYCNLNPPLGFSEILGRGTVQYGVILYSQKCLGLPTGLFFPIKLLYEFIISSMRATCPDHLTPFNLITLCSNWWRVQIMRLLATKCR